MAQLKGTIIVTGANGGLGSATVSQIVSSPELKKSYYGVYTVRCTDAAPSLDAALFDQGSPRNQQPGEGGSFHPHEKISLDLSRLSSVRDTAAAINTRVSAGIIPRIHAIVLNAGYEEFERQTWTAEGLDMAFATNYLGHWLLTMLLLQSMDHEVGRVVWISSWSHNPHDPRNSWNGAFKNRIFNTSSIEPIAKGTWSLSKDDKTGWAAGYRRYGASKLCGVTTISELQRRLDRDPVLNNISVLGIDPGLANTGIVRQFGNWFFRVVLWQFLLPAMAAVLVHFIPNGPLRPISKSARDIIAAALRNSPPPLSPRPKDLYLNGSELGARNPEAKDLSNGAILCRDTLCYTQLKEGETALQDWK
ncbi:NAD(P)-binding protein [Amniculicola lignicola CBS 123094]|uniref:NAD(P)-binding protein n=1 Tax=Amniculicola lignicola CBS 123094 TaxID=1392246 RepID=A0A6A5WTH5_9PLEO|nr:NAD(P)-binding protein [Amniculicola lignicola CBS 123094]